MRRGHRAAPPVSGTDTRVWDPEKGFYQQAYCEAMVGGAKAAIDQHGRIGSVTRTFTITAILQQIAAGNLALDSTIADVLPDLAAKYPDIADIAIDQLAGMTSGIQDYANTVLTMHIVVDDPQHVFSAEELIDAGLSLPLSPPGTGVYSATHLPSRLRLPEGQIEEVGQEGGHEVPLLAGWHELAIGAERAPVRCQSGTEGVVRAARQGVDDRWGGPLRRQLLQVQQRLFSPHILVALGDDECGRQLARDDRLWREEGRCKPTRIRARRTSSCLQSRARGTTCSRSSLDPMATNRQERGRGLFVRYVHDGVVQLDGHAQLGLRLRPPRYEAR